MRIAFQLLGLEHLLVWRQRQHDDWDADLDPEQRVWRNSSGALVLPSTVIKQRIDFGFRQVDGNTRKELTGLANNQQACELQVVEPEIVLFPVKPFQPPQTSFSRCESVRIFRFPDDTRRIESTAFVYDRRVRGEFSHCINVPRLSKFVIEFTVEVPKRYQPDPAPVCEILQRSYRLGLQVDGFGGFLIQRWRIV